MGVREPASGLHQRPAEPVVGAQTSLLPSLVQTVDGVHFAKKKKPFSGKVLHEMDSGVFNQIGRVYFFFFLFSNSKCLQQQLLGGRSFVCISVNNVELNQSALTNQVA